MHFHKRPNFGKRQGGIKSFRGKSKLLVTKQLCKSAKYKKSQHKKNQVNPVRSLLVVNGGWAVAHPPILRLPKRSDKVTNDKKIKFITLTYY